MIIRLTIGDNDFTHIFRNFCIDSKYYTQKRNGFTLLDNLFTIGDWFDDNCGKEIRDKRTHYLGNPHRHWNKKDNEYQELIEEIRRQWKIYAKDNNLESWLIPDVKIQYSLTEKDENGEVCYYFTCTGQCIIM